MVESELEIVRKVIIGLYKRKFITTEIVNHRVYGVSLQEIPRNVRAIPRYQNASVVMVFGAFSKEGKLPLKFIDRGVKINQQLY